MSYAAVFWMLFGIACTLCAGCVVQIILLYRELRR